ncbi:MAG: hypothetical protein PVF45_15370 [Anaerolineae bacterium]
MHPGVGNQAVNVAAELVERGLKRLDGRLHYVEILQDLAQLPADRVLETAAQVLTRHTQ